MRDKEDFRKFKEAFIKIIKEKGVDYVGDFCAMTFLPLTVAYEFVKEELPEHEEFCNKKIKEINDFMGFRE